MKKPMAKKQAACNRKVTPGMIHSAATDRKIPMAKIRFIGPRLPRNSLSEPQPATSEPIKPPTSNSEIAELAVISE
ncbi:hypothetical protein D3C79_1029880 [compost metagenome]